MVKAKLNDFITPLGDSMYIPTLDQENWIVWNIIMHFVLLTLREITYYKLVNHEHGLVHFVG